MNHLILQYFNIWIFKLFFFQYLKLFDNFFVSHCTFKQWLLHQIVTQIEVIQEQIMQWCSFLINLRFYKIILVYSLSLSLSLSPTNQNCYCESTNKNSRICHKEDKTSLKILLVFWTLNFRFTYLKVFLKTTQNLFIKIKIFLEYPNWLSTLIGIDFD